MHYNTMLYTNYLCVLCKTLLLCCYGCCVDMVASCKQEQVIGGNIGLSGVHDIVFGQKTDLSGSTD